MKLYETSFNLSKTIQLINPGLLYFIKTHLVYKNVDPFFYRNDIKNLLNHENKREDPGELLRV